MSSAPAAAPMASYAEANRRSWIGLHQLPNCICVLRVVVVYIALYFIMAQYTRDGSWAVLWFVVTGLASLTDRLDGFLAKRYGWTSQIGAFLDQISDKMVTLALFAFLTLLGFFPAWALGLLVGRELFVSALRIAANELGVPIRTGEAGRFKTFVQQSASLGIFIAWVTAPGWLGQSWGQWVIWGAWGIFGLVMLYFGRRGLRGFHRVYRLQRRRADGQIQTSYADLILVVVTLLCILLPYRIAGPSVVLTITLGTGWTYFTGFLFGLRHGRRRPGRKPQARWWPGPLVAVLGAATTATGLALVVAHSQSVGSVWLLVGAVSLLWIWLLTVSEITDRAYLSGS